MGTTGTATGLGAEGFGGQVHGPEHHPGGGEVDTAGSHNAKDFSTVQGEVARVHGHAKSRDAGEATGAGHVVEARLGIEVMATAGASADGGLKTAAAAGQDMTAGRNGQGTRIHRASAGANVQGKFKREETGGKKSAATLRK